MQDRRTNEANVGKPLFSAETAVTDVLDADASRIFSGIGRNDALPTFPVGTLVAGRYDVLSVLGSGGMGIVYRVADTLDDGRVVALKTMRGAASHAHDLGLFKAEFRTMAKLKHPNVAAVLDFEHLAGSDHSFFTMELATGDNLLRHTEGSGSDAQTGLIVQVCRALSYMHSRGIVHYDLKPANCVVSEAETVKVLDFGIAGGKRRSTQVSGTPLYMAPELGLGVDLVDHRADLYSLGVMWFHLLTRRPPFVAASLPEMMRLHRTRPVELTEEERARIPAWTQQVIARLCAIHPGDRYQTANAVISDINRGTGASYPLETKETRDSYLFSPQLVGREEHLDRQMRFAIDRLKFRRPRVAAFVSGNSGVGKSRLMRELRHRLQLRGYAFIEANCYEASVREYDVFGSIIGRLARHADAIGETAALRLHAAELVKLDPSLTRMLGVAPSPPLDDPKAERYRLHSATAEFLVAVAEKAPCAVYLNDLQWSSPASAALLTYLIDRLGEDRGVPLAIFGSFRDDEMMKHVLAPEIDRFVARGLAEVECLEPLSAANVAALARAMLGVDDVPGEFSRRLADETAGNPFFVEEVMRALVENGSVFLRDGRWATAIEIGALEFPKTAAAVFSRRAAMLDADARAIANVLAVCGRPTALEVIAAVTRLAPDAMHTALRQLLQRAMVASDPDGARYRIEHDRMRETLYAELEAAKRRQLHGDVARAIGATGGPDLFHSDLLAHHYIRAEQWQEAALYGQAAAEEKVGGGRYQEAMADLEQARSCWMRCAAPSEEKMRQLLLTQEHVADVLGLRAEQERILGELPRWLPEEDGEARAEVCVREGEALVLRGAPRASATLERAMLLAAKAGDRALVGRVLRSKSFIAWQEDRIAEAAEHCRQAVAIARELGDEPRLIRDLHNLGILLLGLDDEAGAVACEDELARLRAKRPDDHRLRGIHLHLRGTHHRLTGEMDQAVTVYRQAVEASQPHEILRRIGRLGILADTFIESGRVEEGLAAYEEQLALARKHGQASELARAAYVLGQLRAGLGQTKAALEHFQESVRALRVLERTAQEADAWLEAGSCQLALGQAEDARQSFALALSLGREAGDPRLLGRLLTQRGNVAWSEGRWPEALDSFTEAQAIFSALDDRVHAGLLLTNMGVVLRAQGARERAAVVLLQAIEAHEASGSAALAADAWSVLGHVRREGGDASEAARCQARALELRQAGGNRHGVRTTAFMWMKSYVSEAEGKIYCECEAANPAQALQEREVATGEGSRVDVELYPAMYR